MRVRGGAAGSPDLRPRARAPVGALVAVGRRPGVFAVVRGAAVFRAARRARRVRVRAGVSRQGAAFGVAEGGRAGERPFPSLDVP